MEATVKLSDAVASALDAYPTGTVGAWATNARAAAKARFQAVGLPDRRDEYWKYTNPKSLTDYPTSPAAMFENDEDPMFNDVDRLKLVFVDGVFDASQSDDLSGEGIEIDLLADAMGTDIHWAKELYGVLEEKGQTPVSRPLAILNTAVAEQGICIRATQPTSKPIALRYVHQSDTSDAIVHHVVKVEQGATLTLLESGPGAARFNSVLEVDVADNAEFHHVRTQGRDHERKTITHIFGQLGTQSIFRSFTMTVNGVLTRNEAVLEFKGDDAKATIAAAVAGDGAAFHNDDTVFVTHDSLNCESRQVFKKVLRNGATGVFQGKILVQPEAQKTDGYQISQGLLLDDDSNFLAKPELEIYADDVACSHGSTVGAIDETSLFYLTSRGIPRRQAQDMLVLAFLNEAVEEITDGGLADGISARLAAWLDRRPE